MKRIFFLLLVSCVTSSAAAEPILLAEFERNVIVAERTALQWDITAGNSVPNIWTVTTTAADLGRVYHAPQYFSDTAQRAGTFEVRFICSNCFGARDWAEARISKDEILAGLRTLHFHHVQPSVPSFDGYRITAATQTITKWTPFGGSLGEFGTMISLYGVQQAPEPGSAAYLMFLAAIGCCWRHR